MTISAEPASLLTLLESASRPTMPPHVIVADGDAAVRRTVASTLRRAGYDVDESTDGADLLDRIGHIAQRRAEGTFERLDLVIADVKIPKFSGVEVLECLVLAGWDVPFVLMGYGGASDDRRASGLNASGFLSKPFSAHALLTVATTLAPREEDGEDDVD